MIKTLFKFKIIALILGLLVSACASQLSNTQNLQAVVLMNGTKDTYVTTCSGFYEDQATCYLKAKMTCPYGYDSLGYSVNIVGYRRELTFKCQN